MIPPPAPAPPLAEPRRDRMHTEVLPLTTVPFATAAQDENSTSRREKQGVE